MADKHIPGAKPKGWIEKKWVIEATSSVPPIVIGAVGAYRFWSDPATNTIALWAGAAVLWLVFSSIAKTLHAHSQDKEAAASRDHDGLRAALWVLHAAVGHACKVDPHESDAAVRVTFHRVVPPLNDPQEIEQIVPYVGSDEGGAGRRFSVRSGITGRCVRTMEAFAMHRNHDEFDKYKKELSLEWGFTPADASKITPDRYSLMSVPVLNLTGTQVLGVIYIDAKKRNMFLEDNVLEAIIKSCAGLTRYVSERY